MKFVSSVELVLDGRGRFACVSGVASLLIEFDVAWCREVAFFRRLISPEDIATM
jgi:hypothetical protein